VLPVTTPFLQGVVDPARQRAAGISWPLQVQPPGG